MPFDFINTELTEAEFEALEPQERLLAFIEYLEGLPKEMYFGMDKWALSNLTAPGSLSVAVPLDESDNVCRTPACICGHLLFRFHLGSFKAAVRNEFMSDPPMVSWPERGARVLGITTQQAYELFVPDNVALEEVTKDEAVAVLRRLYETGKIDWEAVLPKHKLCEDED